MRSLAGWMLVLMLLVTPAFAADEAPATDAAPAAPTAEKAPPPAVGDEAPGDESLSSTVADIEAFLAAQPLRFYGHIKLDMAYDRARTNDGNTAMWVLPQPDGDDDNEFNMTARHTRFGFTYCAPESWGPTATAKLEVDFYGGSSENKAGLRLRHAYMNFAWENGISLLAGQSWDLPMVHQQQKLNTAVGWNQGNSAYRRPQIRGTYVGKLGDDGKWDIAVAIADPIGLDLDMGGNDDAEDAGVPDLQARASIGLKIFDDAPPMVIGLGGVIGRREADFATGDEKYDTWLLGIDFALPVSKSLKFLAELYTAQAASTYNASLGYDYNATEETEIGSVGGFLNAVWKMDKYWTFIAGAGACSPDSDDLNDGQRTYNSSVFANARFKITKWGWVGLEVDYMTTHYKASEDFDNLRLQMTFALKF